jgi:hypothetical protein
MQYKLQSDNLQLVTAIEVGIGMGNPGVFQGYPYPYLSKTVPTQRVGVSTGQGRGFEGF